MTYRPPIDDIRTSLLHAAGIAGLEGLPGLEAFDLDIIDPILEEAGKLAAETLAPLNQSGDKQGARLTESGVKTPNGFPEAYQTYAEGGWLGLGFPESSGGQGLPSAVALAVMEMMQAANMSFGLCPMLSLGAVEALIAHGTDEQRDIYLEKIMSGKWSGTMNLTEPQAGSDVGALKTKAEAQDDGSYLINGQKIYITWGDHDCAENIIHLVLARTPGAPEGSRGISLFIVPKFIPDADGNPGEANDLRCIGLELKIGIHASPTCVMEFGGNGGARGWLIGEENRGLACMFTMMNSARLNVGVQGVAVGDAAYQAALEYARERKQGKAKTWKEEGSAPILHHSDVRRNLMTMRSKVMAGRSICYACAMASDLARRGTDESVRAKAKLREELLTPIAKAWSTDMGAEMASLGVQIHGGMGYMNETLAAQLYRDSRIAPIYEGTNGIQAADLVGRKLQLGDGLAMTDMIEEIRAGLEDCEGSNDGRVRTIAANLKTGTDALQSATDWMNETLKTDRDAALASATPYLALAGDVIGGHYLLKSTIGEVRDGNRRHSDATAALSAFYAETILSVASGRARSVIQSGESLGEENISMFDAA